MKADIGCYVKGITPTGGKMPKPTLVLCNFVGCNTYAKWFEHVAALTGAPLYMLDVPFLRNDQPSQADIDYVVRQLHEIVALLERLTGRMFDCARFQQAVDWSRQIEDIWSQIKHLSQHVPSPFDAYFDAITLMGPLYVHRAKREGLEFFKAALAEFQQKCALNQGIYDQEKFRLVFEGPPPYSALSNLPGYVRQVEGGAQWRPRIRPWAGCGSSASGMIRATV